MCIGVSLYVQLYICVCTDIIIYKQRAANTVLQATFALCCKQRAASDKRRDTSDEWRMSAEAAVISS